MMETCNNLLTNYQDLIDSVTQYIELQPVKMTDCITKTNDKQHIPANVLSPCSDTTSPLIAEPWLICKLVFAVHHIYTFVTVHLINMLGIYFSYCSHEFDLRITHLKAIDSTSVLFHFHGVILDGSMSQSQWNVYKPD